MNIIQEIAAALAIIALCTIIHYTIKDWRIIVEELGYYFKKDSSKEHRDA
ncbi:MAG TPA: hypothetical protein VHS53_18090 [Mucilaginibacter sp.]|jgi:hypothetical protein|nr:hypothetical protein [Mucilaginibacter sp.]HEX3387119.1 hypothetical protein [Mucilaginibacter sp.]